MPKTRNSLTFFSSFRSFQLQNNLLRCLFFLFFPFSFPSKVDFHPLYVLNFFGAVRVRAGGPSSFDARVPWTSEYLFHLTNFEVGRLIRSRTRFATGKLATPNRNEQFPSIQDLGATTGLTNIKILKGEKIKVVVECVWTMPLHHHEPDDNQHK